MESLIAVIFLIVGCSLFVLGGVAFEIAYAASRETQEDYSHGQRVAALILGLGLVLAMLGVAGLIQHH